MALRRAGKTEITDELEIATTPATPQVPMTEDGLINCLVTTGCVDNVRITYSYHKIGVITC